MGCVNKRDQARAVHSLLALGFTVRQAREAVEWALPYIVAWSPAELRSVRVALDPMHLGEVDHSRPARKVKHDVRRDRFEAVPKPSMHQPFGKKAA